MPQYINKNISIAGIIAFLFVLIITPVMAWVTSTTLAASPIWNGTAASSFNGGNGTAQNPYQIHTGEQLAYLAQVVNANTNDTVNGGTFGTGKHYILTQDIVLNNTSNWASWPSPAPTRIWTPIGNTAYLGGNSFGANFDGRGFAVSGVYINSTEDCVGLFGKISGSISNLGVKESYIRGTFAVGGIAGYGFGFGQIINCYNSGTIVSSGTGSSGLGQSIAGGIAGMGIIYNCYNTGSVSVAAPSNFIAYAGGIAGTHDESGQIYNCYNSGNVSISSGVGRYAGGIVGSNGSPVANCYNRGTITGTNRGGIAGYNSGGFLAYSYFLTTSGLSAIGSGSTSTTTRNFSTAGTLASSITVPGFSATTSLLQALKDWSSSPASLPTYGAPSADLMNNWMNTPYPVFSYVMFTCNAPADGVQNQSYSFSFSAVSFPSGTITWSVTSGSLPTGLSLSTSGTISGSPTAIGNATFTVRATNTAAGIYFNRQYTIHIHKAWTGTGIQSSPYLISNKADFEYFAFIINNGLLDAKDGLLYNSSTKHFALTADITINNTSGWTGWGPSTTGLTAWTPIGNNTRMFAANFDGRGFVVCGIYISNTSANQGLFGYINGGTIKNVGVKESYIRGGSAVGAIAGYVTGNTASVTACYNMGNVVGASNNAYVGGVVGHLLAGATISQCFNGSQAGGNVSATGAGTARVGGIVGYVDASTISDSYNTGNIISTGGAGGIAGFTTNAATSISRCYNAGTVTGIAGNTGAVVGNSASGTVSSCYYNSNAFSGATIGNIAGTSGATLYIDMVKQDTLTTSLSGLGSAWVKRPNESDKSFYPELKVFATDLT
ncbi:MAG: hypothetical protein FWE53_04970 [Firmicutes bacterium]|nr:hypothetical protein [Bacillota bacterium]